MAKPTTITKEIIIEAAFGIVQRGGQKMLSARNIAKQIGCSTQPIYWTYQNMEMLKQDVIVKMEQHLTHQMSLFKRYEHPHLNMCMSYLFLANKEPMFFREFYIDNIKNINLEELMPIAIWENIDTDNPSHTMHHALTQKWLLIHGIATLITSGALAYNEAIIEKMLRPLFE